MKVKILLAIISINSAILHARRLNDVELKFTEIEAVDNSDRKEWNEELQKITFKIPIQYSNDTESKNANIIGRESDSKKEVTTKSNIGQCVAKTIGEILQANGLKTSENSGYQLIITPKDLFVHEDNMYNGKATIRYVIIAENGDTLHDEVCVGTKKKWGSSYDYDNYMETLTSALHYSVFNFLKSKFPNGSAKYQRNNAVNSLTNSISGLQNSGKETLAILPFESSNMDIAVSKTLSDLLINTMQSNGKYRVVERDQISKILQEQGFQNNGACSATGCAVEIGKLLSVKKIIVGSIGKLGSIFIINARLIDVQSGEIEANSSKKVTGGIENSAESILDIASDLSKSTTAIKSEKTEPSIQSVENNSKIEPQAVAPTPEPEKNKQITIPAPVESSPRRYR